MRRSVAILGALLAGCFGDRQPQIEVIIAPKNEPVVIPGDRLVPQPEQARYTWRVAEQPAAATVRLFDVESPRPSFETDRSGRHVLEAQIRTGLNELTATIRIDVFNTPPTVAVGPGDLIVETGGIGSIGLEIDDLDRDRLAIEVRTVDAPVGSTATGNARFREFRFVPDLEGDYLFEITVDDGEATASALVNARATPRIRVLLSDAEGLFAHSRPLDVVAIFADRRVRFYDVAADRADGPQTVITGSSLAVSPDGQSLVVGGGFNSTRAEIPTGELTSIGTGAVTQLAFGPDSRLFFAGTSTNADVLSEYDLLGDQVFPGAFGTFPTIRSIAVAANQPAIYGARDGGLAKWTTTTTPPEVSATLDAETCDAIWLADDGSLLIDATGSVYALSDDPAQDLVALGSLEGTTPPACAIRHVDVAAAAGIAAVIRSDTPDQIWIYDLASRTVAQSIPLPEVPPQPPVALAALAVFLTADGSSYRLLLDYNGQLGVFVRPVPQP